QNLLRPFDASFFQYADSSGKGPVSAIISMLRRHDFSKVPFSASAVFGFKEKQCEFATNLSNAQSGGHKMATKSLYVGNLPYSATEATLLEYFAPYGATSARIVEGRGFGFIDIDEANAQQAIDDKK